MVCRLALEFSAIGLWFMAIALIVYSAYSLTSGNFHRKPRFSSLSEWGSIAITVSREEAPLEYWLSNIACGAMALFCFYLLSAC